MEYAPVDWGAEVVAERLTMSGSEVEHMRDGVMEVKVTPNRGDTLSMVGLAREVAALSRQNVHIPDTAVPEGAVSVFDLARVDVDAQDLCPRYAARVVQGVKIGPSPEWLAQRVEAAGLRSISNVVDITNYVMLEFGQPLHAFDYDLLAENRIVVRRAKPGETLTTIDGDERSLSPDMLVIADADKAVAVAGVMGGVDSEISDGTTNVLLESAHFDALSIRRTAKALGMSTDASYRFERTVDPAGVVLAIDRAAQLLVRVAGGTVAQGVIDRDWTPSRPRVLSLRPERCNTILGLEFSAEQMTDALASLNLSPVGESPIQCTIPTYRPDLVREDDLAEEVGRILGYDLIPANPVNGEHLHGGLSAPERFRRQLHTVALSCGWQEAVNPTLADDEIVCALGFTATARLSNPLSREVNVIRPSLLPGVVDSIRRNLRQQRTSLGFYEIGRAHQMVDGAPREDVRWAAAVIGPVATPSWTGQPAVADFYTLKGSLESAFAALRAGAPEFTAETHEGFHPGRTAGVVLNGRRIGFIGELHPDLAAKWDIAGRLVMFEVDVAALHHAAAGAKFAALPRFPGATRDISFVVDRSLKQATIAAIIREAAGPLLTDLTLFDLYRGERLSADKQSMAYRLTLRSDDRTLSDEEANGIRDAVRAALAEKAGAPTQ